MSQSVLKILRSFGCRFLPIPIFCLIVFFSNKFSIISPNLYSHPLTEFSSILDIEDFSKFVLQIEDFTFYGNSEKKPVILLSNLITSPYSDSNQTLLIRLPKEIRLESIEFRKQNPWILDDFTLELELSLYNNTLGGDLVLLVEDVNLEVQKVFLKKLNFVGWKWIRVPVHKLAQSDFVLGEKKSIKLIGFVYKPPQDSERNREILLGIDRIRAYSLPKYKLRRESPEEQKWKTRRKENY